MPGSFTDSCLVCLYLLPHLIVHIIYFLAQILNALAVFQLGKIREHSLVTVSYTHLDVYKRQVKEHMDEAGIEASVGGRVKHFFSIYKKMVKQNKTLDQIYDLFAVRIMVETVKDCYAALGVIHEMYKPIPGRFKDYIAMPKPNMYQSLHTTLIGSTGQPFEIQIRTYEMHRTAEYGIAAVSYTHLF